MSTLIYICGKGEEFFCFYAACSFCLLLTGSALVFLYGFEEVCYVLADIQHIGSLILILVDLSVFVFISEFCVRPFSFVFTDKATVNAVAVLSDDILLKYIVHIFLTLGGRIAHCLYMGKEVGEPGLIGSVKYQMAHCVMFFCIS